ncbi:MAG: DNA polymerase III subunit gamma/tau [Chloroflexota bacterium]|nr:DNA polymerase III subunit gamma/tau [Chloroflexota bacterium]
MSLNREVLYQKWRPKQFSDVMGQDHITVTLRNSLLRNKYAHAYLFTGPRGVGKTSTARILAKALNLDIDEQGEPKLDSKISEEIDAGKFLDLIEIDAASNRRIDDIRSLLDNVQFMPSSGKYKVYIIDEVHMLTNEAFNALLKTLEEPPPQVIMILATTEYQKLPETIVSRCQRFDFRNVSNAEVVKRLKIISENEKIDCKEEILWFIAETASGSLRDACNLLEQLSIAFDEITIDKARELFGIIDENVSLNIFKLIIEDNKSDLIATLQDLRLRGVDFKSLSSSLINVLRLGIFTSNGATDIQGHSKDFIKNTSDVFHGIESKKLIVILEKFIDMISIRTEHFDALLDSSLLHLTYIFEVTKLPSKEGEVAYKIPEKPILKSEEEDIKKDKDTQNLKTTDEVYREDKPINNDTLSDEELNSNKVTTSVDASEKQDWEKVLFDLRRAKFGKMVLGALLRNVEIPKKIQDRLVLKFKSKSLHDHFKSEWQLDLAREAVKKAVTKVYGEGIKLVLEEPDEEQSTNTKSNLLESDIVKSALAMGAKVEEQKEG